MKKQHGFAALEGILILVVIVVIGGVGWYALHTKHQTDKILSQADKVSQNTPAISNKSNASASTTSHQKYFTITQWGVRAPYSDYLSLEYQISTSTAPQSADFSSKQLDDSAGVSCIGYGGEVVRYKSSDTVKLEDGTSAGKTAAEYFATFDKTKFSLVGAYYYMFKGPQSTCGNDNGTLQQQTLNDIRDLAAHLQSVPQ